MNQIQTLLSQWFLAILSLTLLSIPFINGMGFHQALQAPIGAFVIGCISAIAKLPLLLFLIQNSDDKISKNAIVILFVILFSIDKFLNLHLDQAEYYLKYVAMISELLFFVLARPYFIELNNALEESSRRRLRSLRPLTPPYKRGSHTAVPTKWLTNIML